MARGVPPFALYFEHRFLDGYERLGARERRAVDRAVARLSLNPRHPSLNTHKAKGVDAKYLVGGTSVFIAYVTRTLRLTFEFGPEQGMIALRNCGQHDPAERQG